MWYAGPGQIPTIKGALAQEISLASGECYTISPAGDYFVRAGKYTTIQQYDPYTGSWRRIGGGVMAGGVEYIRSDGVNYRLANQTGCLVGAIITNAGSGYTSAPVVTVSAGASLWKAFVGGAVSATVTVNNGGTNYTYPPICVISPPPVNGGICATADCTLSSGAVSTVTIRNQGAGYTTAPTITFVNDPRENPNIAIAGSTVTAGSGAAATLTLTGANTITGVICQDHGTGGQTSVPTFTFTGGGGSSAAAVGIMCWTITALAVSTAGAGLSGAQAWITAEENASGSAPVYLNPDTGNGSPPTVPNGQLVTTRKADARITITSNALVTPATIYDGGIYTAAPTVLVIPNASVATTAPVVTATMGGATDVSYIMPL